ncbi:putative chitinase 3 [Folsomia candida]|uniref:chitinase n=1 Tax=Folsomia candida TaxID=158441 RepID=A0A226ERN1_FOLCA|nr:putative chitinase 3 [Folsomia candida]
MVKIAIFLLAATVIGHWAERTPNHLVYRTVNFPNQSRSINPQSSATFSFVPYSNTYPFYALWNNERNVGRPFAPHRSIDPSGGVGISNQIPQMPPSSQQQQQHLGIGSGYNNGQNSAQTPFVVPFATISEAYDNLWNYDFNSLRPKIHAVQTPPQFAADKNDDTAGGWNNIPLKSYEQIVSDAGHHLTGFHRGQVESSSMVDIFFPQHGFTRGHVEFRPAAPTTNPIVRAAATGEIYKTGFSRGAVESSDFPRRTGHQQQHQEENRIIRYEADTPTSNNKVICYFASWSYYRTGKGSFSPENANPSLCTHVIYAFANLDKNKIAIRESDPQLDLDKQFYQRFTALKQRNPNLKVLLGLGGWSDSGDDKYSILANNAEYRRKFSVETAKYLKDKNFDGLSVDWHYPKCWQSQCENGPDSDKLAFTELIKELQNTFKPQGLIVSATLSGYKEVVDLAYDIPSLSQHLDLMNVMAYDYHGAWEVKTGHLAPLFTGPPSFDPYPSYNVNYTMQYYLSKGADRSKLIVGVPMYGQSFHLSNPGDSSYGSEAIGPGLPGEFTQQPGMLAYYEICLRVKDKQWTSGVDRTGSWGPYAYKDSEWVGYDDSDFLTRKARYVKQQQLGGMFVWTMDLDDFQNQCCMGSQPLLRTIAKELLGVPYDPNVVDCTPPVVPKPSVETTTSKPGQVRPPTEHPTSTWWPQTSTSTIKPPPSTPLIPESSTPSTTTLGSTASTTISPPLSTTLSTTPDSSNGTTNSPPESASSAPVVFICQQINGSDSQMSVVPHMTTAPTPTSPTSPTSEPEGGGGVPIPENTCDNTWIFKPDPSDCSMYYECTSGKAFKKQCPQGLHWNQYQQACDWPEYANCGGTAPTSTYKPPSSSQATWPPSTTTKWTTTQQPTTRPPMTQMPSTTYRPSGERCRSGEYSPGPTCDRYYVCVDGTQTLQSCGPGLHWNSQKTLCDWPKSAMCQTSSGGGSDVPSIQETKFPKNCQQGEYYGDEDECDVYYVCNHGHPIQFRCQSGLHWNNNGKICDWPANAGCQNSGGRPTTTTTSGPIYTDAPSTTMRPATTRPTTTASPSTRPPTTTAVTTTSSTSSSPWTTTTTSSGSGSEVVVPDSGSNAKDFMIVCYFTNWAWYRPGIGKYKPEDINPKLCTHIVYGFAVLDYTDLTLKPHDTWADFDNHFYEQVTAYKKGGTKVTLAIGGWNDSQGDKYSRLVNNPASRKKFITHAIEFIKKYNFDGLDLDWEYPKCWQVECDKGPASDKPNFAEFVKELKLAFQPHGLLLSAAVSPSKLVIDQGYDVPTVARYLDWIAVMTYDFHGQWDKKTGHVAPLYFHEDDDFAYFNANYSISICKHVQKDGWTVVHDETGAMGPYAYKGNQWVSYDDVAMIRKKSQLIRDMGLGGGMVWALDLDDFRNTCGQGAYPLLTTIKNVLGKPKLTDDHDSSASTPDMVEMPVMVTKKPATTTTKRTVTTTRPKTTTTRRSTTTAATTTRRTVTTRPTTRRPPNKIVGSVETDDAFIIGEHEAAINNLQHNQQNPTSSQPTTPTTTTAITPPGSPVAEKDDDCQTRPFKPHESDCNKYYMCIFGNYAEYQCAPGTYWNKDHCDWVCGSEPGQSSTTPGNWQSTTTTKVPMRPTQQTTTSSTTTTTQRPWTPAPTMPSTTVNWNPTTSKPSTSTSWEWKPPIITTTTIHPIEVPDSDFLVVCYFTNWAWYRQGIGKYKPEDIDYNLCTHIAYGFAVLNPSTLEIRTHDSWADTDNQFYTQVTDLKSKGKKVVIAIGGWNDSLGDKYSRLVRDAAARRKFIKNVIEFIQKYNFDGLDLDWEYPKCWQTDCKLGPADDKENFATFARELKEAFTPHGYLLSSAVSPSKTIIDEGYDVPIISQYLDWIAVMTYDYHGQWDKKTGHVAPMYNHEESDNFYFNSNYTINYWISKGAPKKKLVMGMPMYGQSFTLTQASNHGLNAPSTGGGQAGEFTRAQGFLAYYEICKSIKGQGWTVVRDDTGAIGPYAYKGDQWVSFDDVDMIRKKSQYVKDMGIGGAMIWALDLDDFRNVCGCEKHPLLKTINRVLRDYPEPDPKCNL